MANIGISTIQMDSMETRVTIQTVVVVPTKDVASFKKELQAVVDKYAV